MSFYFYNKLNKPIYIDWKNSSFIYNGNKLDYWIDETVTNSASYYGAYYYKGEPIRPGLTASQGIALNNSKTFKPERITFIPPKANINRSQFKIYTSDH
jgi:hypothetical protein